MKVGTYYSEANDTRTESVHVGDHYVEIRYNCWSEQGEECVTQEVYLPGVIPMGQASMHEWLVARAIEMKALEKAGFYAFDVVENAVFWKRNV